MTDVVLLMNEDIGSCTYNITQNLCRSTKIRGTKCENLAKIHRWRSYGTMTIYGITRNCRFHKKSVANWHGWPTYEDAHLHRFCCHYQNAVINPISVSDVISGDQC